MERLKSFNIDFNWLGKTYSPASAFVQADAAQLAQWYQEMGCNNFWTFAISYNGCAWYDSDYAPKAQGLRGNFTQDCVREGHKRGMSVFAYHCLAANPVVEARHPEWSRGNPQDLMNLIFCDDYLDWFCGAIRESITQCEYDGLVIDWFRGPSKRRLQWVPTEKALYRQLMGEDCPESPDPVQTAAFEKRSIEHAWRRIRETVKSVKDIPIWTNQPFDEAEDPVWNGNILLKEADYILNESPDTTLLPWLQREAGPNTCIVQNLCGWQEHDLIRLPPELENPQIGLFGFAAADPETCLPYQRDNICSAEAKSVESSLLANMRNIPVVRRIYRGE